MEINTLLDPCYHPSLELLALERTGWRRWVFGRWVHSSEPFRRDIQRRVAKAGSKAILKPWEQNYHPYDRRVSFTEHLNKRD